ncbi:hypothetical protein BVC80_1827g50 [Macleaya cordata]|uniref:DUF7054 domain-containing protein n=1 Tax=Macleaya cordata TaxID=56857 RepID=A0A200QB16_MACCD|nr:hypothetical protein BVC80_1827g50 [Macleaya cordata]
MSTSRHTFGRESDTDRNPVSINSHVPITSDLSTKIQYRPEIHSEFHRERSIAISGKSENNGSQKLLTKLLLNVTIQRSLGPVQVVTSPEKTVGELIEAALQIYVKEKRRPFLTETDPQCFELHYSQFSLERSFGLFNTIYPKGREVDKFGISEFLFVSETDSYSEVVYVFE